jgi:hypothetical protein
MPSLKRKKSQWTPVYEAGSQQFADGSVAEVRIPVTGRNMERSSQPVPNHDDGQDHDDGSQDGLPKSKRTRHDQASGIHQSTPSSLTHMLGTDRRPLHEWKSF